MPVPDDLPDTSTGTDLLSVALPPLTPLLVAGEEEIDQVVRTARAGIAILSLQLRTVERSATLAEAQDTDWDLPEVQGLLEATLGHQMETRRREMAEEVNEARREAVRLVVESRATAADLIAQAGAESLERLMAGTGVDRTSEAPSLRIISRPRADPVEQEVHDLTHPVAQPAREDTPAPAASGIEPMVAAIPVVVSPDAPVMSTLVMPTPVVPTPVISTPVVPTPVVPTPVMPAGVAIAAESVAVETARAGESVTAPVDVPTATQAAVIAGPSAVSATIISPVVAVPAALADPAVTQEPKPRSSLSRFFYLDVLLPMVAVLILIVVLLAWVG